MSVLIPVLLAIIQATALSYVTVLGHTADLVLLAVVARSILHGRQEGLLWGVIGGATLDLLSVAPFGTHTLALSVVALVTSVRGRDFFHSWAFYPLLAAGLATLILDMVVVVVLLAFRRELGLTSVPMTVTLPRALLNAMAMAPMFWLLYQRAPRGRAGEGRGPVA